LREWLRAAFFLHDGHACITKLLSSLCINLSLANKNLSQLRPYECWEKKIMYFSPPALLILRHRTLKITKQARCTHGEAQCPHPGAHGFIRNHEFEALGPPGQWQWNVSP
jgi:hypothetical protein